MIAEDVEGLVLSGESEEKYKGEADTKKKTNRTFEISSRTAGIVAAGFLILGIALLCQIRENQGIKESCENYTEIEMLEKENSISAIIDMPHAREIKRRFMGLDGSCRAAVLSFVEENKICAIKAINLCG